MQGPFIAGPHIDEGATSSPTYGRKIRLHFFGGKFGKADEVSLLFYEYAERILNLAGVEAVEEDVDAFDISFFIEARGIPRDATYLFAGRQWTGATLYGTISLSTEEGVFE